MDDLIKQIQRINRLKVVGFLELCCSGEELLRYQIAVPYVEFPRELFCQWDSLYIQKQEWFKSNYTNTEMSALRAFNKVMRGAFKQIPPEIVDLENAIDLPDWIKVMTAAHTALRVIKKE